MKRFTALSVLFLLILLSACSIEKGENAASSYCEESSGENQEFSQSEPSVSEEISVFSSGEEERSDAYEGTDYTVKGDFKEYHDLESKNIITVSSYLEYSMSFPNLDSLISHSREAVEFVVEEIKYAFLEGGGYTICNVAVTKSFAGNLRAGDKISLLQYGGIYTIEEETAYWHDEDRFSGLTEEQRKNALIVSAAQSSVDYHPGDVFVAFLGKADFPEGAYCALNDGEGVFMYRDQETLVRCYAENYEQNELNVGDLLSIEHSELYES